MHCCKHIMAIIIIIIIIIIITTKPTIFACWDKKKIQTDKQAKKKT